MARLVAFVWHEPAFNYVFKSWPGPVGRHINRIGVDTVVFARPLIGRKYAAVSTRSGSGRLARALRVVHRFAPNRDVEAHAGANPAGGIKGYALWHHEPTGQFGGRGRYMIRPVRARLLRYKLLSGQTVYRTHVWHPGSIGQKYLLRALRRAMR